MDEEAGMDEGPPREFRGYGGCPPEMHWPGGAAVAVNFCVNYEEGAEHCVLDGDPASEERISDVAVTARPGRRDLNIESSYEYGARVGYWRLIRAFAAAGVPYTVNLCGAAAEKTDEALRAMLAAGADLQLHGWRWTDYAAMPGAEERALLDRARAQARELTGAEAPGVYVGMPSVNTRRLVAEAGFLYHSDVYNDDLPYWAPDHPGLLLMPYSLDTNDSRFARANGGYQVAGDFVAYIADTLAVLRAEAAEGMPSLLTIGLHARLIGRPGRIGAVHRILDAMAGMDDIWLARRSDIARHWAETLPDPRLAHAETPAGR